MSSGDLPEQEPLKVTPGWAMRRACRPGEGMVRAPAYEPPSFAPEQNAPAPRHLVPRPVHERPLGPGNGPWSRGVGGVPPELVSGRPGPLAEVRRVPERLRRPVAISDVVTTPEPAPPPWDAVRRAVPGDVELRRAGVLSEGERFWVFTTRTPAPPRMRPPLGTIAATPPPAPVRAEDSARRPRRPKPGTLILPERGEAWSEGRFQGVRGALAGVVLVALGVALAVAIGLVLSPLEPEGEGARGRVSVEVPGRPGALPF